MDAKDIYLQLSKNVIRVSEALAYARVFVTMTAEERLWVDSEVTGYSDKYQVPEYRQLSCKIKARVRYNNTHEVSDIDLQGGGIDELDDFLKNNLGLSVYKLYITQGVEWIEDQVADHVGGDIIMFFEGGPLQDLKQSLSSEALKYNFSVLEIFQSASVQYARHMINVVKNKLINILSRNLRLSQPQTYNTVDEGVDNMRKVIFVSYCWESDEHKEWVYKLVTDLSEEFEIKIDQKLPLGIELTQFMESSIANSDKVLIIATPEYKNRADNRVRGVGYETSLITDELVTEKNKIKFIPIIRIGSKETSYPSYLGSRKGLDMTNDDKYQENLEVLRENLREY